MRACKLADSSASVDPCISCIWTWPPQYITVRDVSCNLRTIMQMCSRLAHVLRVQAEWEEEKWGYGLGINGYIERNTVVYSATVCYIVLLVIELIFFFLKDIM